MIAYNLVVAGRRLICRKKFSEGEDTRLMPPRARVDVAQTHRFPEFLNAPRHLLADVLPMFVPPAATSNVSVRRNPQRLMWEAGDQWHHCFGSGT
jgi:hypothetical protein